MNENSGFRTIEFVESVCKYIKFEVANFKVTICKSGCLYSDEVLISYYCPICEGTGKIEKARSTIE
jgi:hypothetical protein